MNNSTLIDKIKLEKLYARYNRRKYVHPDPLEFLHNYNNLADREIAGLIASSLAFGRVAQIIRNVSTVLERMTTSPAAFIHKTSEKTLLKIFPDFKHRWATGREIASMLVGVKRIIKQYGSLQDCFTAGLKNNADTLLPALIFFANELRTAFGGGCRSLIPMPDKGSACKRLNLFLRWMVRYDEVDPGGWTCVSPAKLIVPLDTHMHCISLSLKLTDRKQANMKTALEITRAFKRFSPNDPVKYDFALTRLGIRNDTDLPGFLKRCGIVQE